MAFYIREGTVRLLSPNPCEGQERQQRCEQRGASKSCQPGPLSALKPEKPQSKAEGSGSPSSSSAGTEPEAETRGLDPGQDFIHHNEREHSMTTHIKEAQ